jgi:hypothetical protein
LRRSKQVPDWIGSLGKASLKRAIQSGRQHGLRDGDDGDDDDDGRSEDFDHPPRKSVLFKEYAFSVQVPIL